ncbi:MAG: DUF1905 domain-containing protein [Sphingomicrobium sp.]
MITFTSLLWIWKGEAAGRWYFLTLPEKQSAAIKAQAFVLPRGFGSVRVEAAIGEVRWRTSVFPLNTGGYILPVKADIRKRAKLAAGDSVTAELTPID